MPYQQSMDLPYHNAIYLPFIQNYKGFIMKNCLKCDTSFQPVGKDLCCSIKCNLLHFLRKNENGCWLYKNDSYGVYSKISINGKSYRGHRISYETFVGKIESGKWICHKCDEPKCINPDHLFMGSASENARDAFKKNRRVKGELHHWARFNDIQVSEMRLLHNEGISYARLSRIFNCAFTTVVNIIKEKNRRDFNVSIPTE